MKKMIWHQGVFLACTALAALMSATMPAAAEFQYKELKSKSEDVRCDGHDCKIITKKVYSICEHGAPRSNGRAYMLDNTTETPMECHLETELSSVEAFYNTPPVAPQDVPNFDFVGGEAVNVLIGTFSDADGDALSFSSSGGWPGSLHVGKVSNSQARISGTASPGVWSNLSIAVSDGYDTSYTNPFTVSVSETPSVTGRFSQACGDEHDSCVIIDWWVPAYAVIRDGVVEIACYGDEGFRPLGSWNGWASWANQNWPPMFVDIGLHYAMAETQGPLCNIGDYDDWYVRGHATPLTEIFRDPSYPGNIAGRFWVPKYASEPRGDHEIYWFDLE